MPVFVEGHVRGVVYASRTPDNILRLLYRERGKLALRAPSQLVPGPLTVTIDFTAPLAVTETAGTFRQKVGEDWYVFTQHEAISARRSFPCLDEPDSKVPWKVTLRVPSALICFSPSSTAFIARRNASISALVSSILPSATRAVMFSMALSLPVMSSSLATISGRASMMRS